MRKRIEQMIDGLICVAAIVLILVLVYTVALRVLAASDETDCISLPPDGENYISANETKLEKSVRMTAKSVSKAAESVTESESPDDAGESLPQPAAPAAPSSEGAEKGCDAAALADAVIVREDIPMDKLHQTALVEICREAGVDINLAYGLIMTESSFDPYAVSATGCYGYCQLSCYFPAGLSPVENLRAGIGWLGELITQHGDVGKALTVYHLGHDDGTRDYANVALGYARGWGYEG